MLSRFELNDIIAAAASCFTYTYFYTSLYLYIYGFFIIYMCLSTSSAQVLYLENALIEILLL